MQSTIAELRKRANALHNFTKKLDFKQDCSAEDYDELYDLLSYFSSFVEGKFKAEIDAKTLRQERERLDNQLIDALNDLRNAVMLRSEENALAVDINELNAAEALKNAILSAYINMGLN